LNNNVNPITPLTCPNHACQYYEEKFTMWEDKKCTYKMSMGKSLGKHPVGRL
jgi:hypothetical protein